MTNPQLNQPNETSSQEEIAHWLQAANDAYRIGEPLVSDGIYDHWTEELRAKTPKHPLLDSPEIEPDFGKGKIHHVNPMLSLDKAYTDQDIQKYIQRIIKAASELGLEPKELEFHVSAKLDGVAGRFDGSVLATRGDGLIGNDITHIFGLGVRNYGSVHESSVGEIVMTKHYADKEGIEHGRARNVVAGILSAETLNQCAIDSLNANAVRFVPFDSLGGISLEGVDWVSKVYEVEKRLQEQCEYPTDGIVITVKNEEVVARLGSSSRAPRYSIAKKSVGESALTTVRDVRYSVGRTGRLTPVLQVEPVRVSGCTISSVTSHHVGRLVESGAGIGSQVEICRAGEIIPKVTAIIKPVQVSLPVECPSCSSALESRDDNLYCVNASGCEEQAAARMEHFFKQIGVKEFGPSTCIKLVKNQINTIHDVYVSDEAQFLFAGFGEKVTIKLMNEVRQSLVNPIEDFKLVAALGIHKIWQRR